MSALRPLRQLAASSSRAFASWTAPRSLAFTRTQAAQWAQAGVPQTARSFSATARSQNEGTSDVSLVQKLKEEIKFEKQAAAEAGVPEFMKEFQTQGVWSIEDTPGNDEVALTRTFGHEKIRLLFSVADLEGQTEFPNEEEEGEGGEENETPLGTYPIRCSFTITKTNAKGAISIDALCQEGTFVADNISFYPEANLATDLTAEADWKRRGLYIGPQFDQLDPSVQEEFEKYFEERGISESLALFIPEYAEYKEQKEYVKWLENVKTFVEN